MYDRLFILCIAMAFIVGLFVAMLPIAAKMNDNINKDKGTDDVDYERDNA